ncbi:MAG: type I methionyl aminopeptidase [Bacteroidetes bacterium]|nr:type I methionyl aminopeptidase [Bacteroidota bacterium]
MAIFYKTNEEIELVRISSLLVGKTLAEVAKVIKPGIATAELDKTAEKFIRDNGGVPSFKGYNGFPASLCISVNSVVVHGIPGKYELQDGDIISVDCGVYKNGFHGDSAYTFAVGNVKPETLRLLKVTKECLYKGVEVAVAGKRLGDISYTIQEYAESNGYSVVRELVGHGIGKDLHEAPEVPNYGKRGSGPVLQEGLVIAIEPMINLGKKAVKTESDGWTIRTQDNMPSAHFEHTIAVRAGKADVLSTFEYIEAVLNEKKELVN